MVASKGHKGIVRKLKKQVTTLKRKEKVFRNKLRAALSKVKKIERGHLRKLEQHKKLMTKKIVLVEASVYAKLAKAIQKKAKMAKKVNKSKKSSLKQAHKSVKASKKRGKR